MTLTWPWPWGNGVGYCWIKLSNYIYYHPKYEPNLSNGLENRNSFNADTNSDANANADAGVSAIALPGLCPGELKKVNPTSSFEHTFMGPCRYAAFQAPTSLTFWKFGEDF